MKTVTYEPSHAFEEVVVEIQLDLVCLWKEFHEQFRGLKFFTNNPIIHQQSALLPSLVAPAPFYCHIFALLGTIFLPQAGQQNSPYQLRKEKERDLTAKMCGRILKSVTLRFIMKKTPQAESQSIWILVLVGFLPSNTEASVLFWVLCLHLGLRQ